MMRGIRVCIGVGVLAGASAFGQVSPGRTTPGQERTTSPIKTKKKKGRWIQDYSQQRSRQLFAACDEDGDDRIEWFEAFRSLQDMSRTRFQGFDTNNDGRIQFNEFDAKFQQRTAYGGEIRLTERAWKRLPSRVAGQLSDHPALIRFLASFDTNRNERLEKEEWKRPESMLGKKPGISFETLDRDLSGHLTASELKPLLRIIEVLDTNRSRGSGGAPKLRPLPTRLRVADLDSDTLISGPELVRALARIHPSLIRYAPGILAKADLNGDKHLDVHELRTRNRK